MIVFWSEDAVSCCTRTRQDESCKIRPGAAYLVSKTHGAQASAKLSNIHALGLIVSISKAVCS